MATEITDDGLACLDSMTNLEFLDVTFANLSGDSLKYLFQKHPKLRSLYFSKGRIDDATIEGWRKANPGLDLIVL